MPTYVLPVRFPVAVNSPVAALSSAGVLDRLGTQVHMASDFPIYANNVATVTSLLNDLGVDHVRDTYNVGFPTQHVKQLQVAADTGVKFTMTGRLSDSITSTINGLVSDGMAGILAALEGCNEPDNAGGSWAANAAAYQQAFYAAAKAKTELAALPVLAPGLANSINNAASLGDLSAYCDRGNAHIYSGNPPTGVGSYTIANTLIKAKLVAGAKGVVITEQGYHNEPSDNSPIPYVDETTAAVYAPKILLENVLAGTERVFIYELLDQGTGADDQQHYGLCRNDLSKKPAFNAIARMTALLSDPGSAYTPAPLSLGITPAGGDTSVRSLLVGRRDGSYRLFLWRDVSVWNPTAHTAITVAPINVAVTLDTAKTVSRTNLTTGATATLGSTAAMDISLAGDVLVLDLATPTAGGFGTAPFGTSPFGGS